MPTTDSNTDGWRWESRPAKTQENLTTAERFRNLVSMRKRNGNKCVIFGLGQLGRDIATSFRASGWDVAGFTKLGCDITNHDQVIHTIKSENPDLIINCAAVHHLPQCEAFPDAAHLVNVSAAARIAFIANAIGAPLVYISTDQVFDGKKDSPYTEKDRCHPLNTYAKQKAWGEAASQGAAELFIIRTGCLFGRDGSAQKGGNFITKLLSQRRIVMTQRGRISASYTKDLADGIKELIRTAKPGIYHLANAGETSWYELAKYAIDRSGLPIELIPTDEDPSGIPRPAYSVLDCSKAAAVGVLLPPWTSAVDRYLDEIRSVSPELL